MKKTPFRSRPSSAATVVWPDELERKWNPLALRIDHSMFALVCRWEQLGLARAYALAGDLAQSRKAYEDFFALWKDADPDIPILQQAKAEYAKLN